MSDIRLAVRTLTLCGPKNAGGLPVSPTETPILRRMHRTPGAWVPVAELVALTWTGKRPANAYGLVKSAICTLRVKLFQVGSRDVIETGPECYRVVSQANKGATQ